MADDPTSAPTPTSCPPEGTRSEVTWEGVGIAASLIALNVIISVVLNLRISKKLIISACRCTVQLTVMGLVLVPVFDSQNVYLVMGLAGLLLLLATFETTYHKGKRRFYGMFWIMLVTMLITTGAATLIGTAFAMNAEPFWEPTRFIPTFGMLLGNMMASVALAVNYCLDTIVLNKDQIDIRLSFGATWWEASRPMAVEALRLAMLPTLNAMSVMGLITIPGMMTGQILAGESPAVASRYQMVMMFLIASSTGAATVLAVMSTLLVVFDRQHRLRTERVTEESFIVYQYAHRASQWFSRTCCDWRCLFCPKKRIKVATFSSDQVDSLLSSPSLPAHAHGSEPLTEPLLPASTFADGGDVRVPEGSSDEEGYSSDAAVSRVGLTMYSRS